MEKDTKTEDKEPYQNVYEQYYHFNSEWHNWQRYIGGVIAANGANVISNFAPPAFRKVEQPIIRKVEQPK